MESSSLSICMHDWRIDREMSSNGVTKSSIWLFDSIMKIKRHRCRWERTRFWRNLTKKRQKIQMVRESFGYQNKNQSNSLITGVKSLWRPEYAAYMVRISCQTINPYLIDLFIKKGGRHSRQTVRRTFSSFQRRWSEHVQSQTWRRKAAKREWSRHVYY